MIFDLTQVGLYFIILSILGYIGKHTYDLGFYQYHFHLPRKKGEFAKFLDYVTSGVIIVLLLFGIFFVILNSGESSKLEKFFDPAQKTLERLVEDEFISENSFKSLFILIQTFCITN